MCIRENTWIFPELNSGVCTWLIKCDFDGAFPKGNKLSEIKKYISSKSLEFKEDGQIIGMKSTEELFEIMKGIRKLMGSSVIVPIVRKPKTDELPTHIG